MGVIITFEGERRGNPHLPTDTNLRSLGFGTLGLSPKFQSLKYTSSIHSSMIQLLEKF